MRPVPAEVRHHVFFILKEALRNIVDHASAREVLIRVSVRSERLSFTVRDDGCGFDLSAARPQGNGLGNMEARAAACGGSFSLESQPGAGTHIVVELSLDSGNVERHP